jgi:hypothetical protein
MTPSDLLLCCASVVAHANWMRKEALDRGDQSQVDAMLGRVDGIYVLAAMLGLGVQRVHDLAVVEEERLVRAVRKVA